MLRDLRSALRSLSNTPGFAAAAIGTLALGIGASTAIFSVVSGVLLASLPYPSSDRLMEVRTVFESGNAGSVSYPNFEDLRDESESFAGLAAYASWTVSAAAGGEGFRIDWANVSPGFFSVFDVEPALGRVFSEDEERDGGQVAVVSYGYWQDRLASSTSFADRSVRIGERVYSVIGVMPRGYDYPVGTQLWVPREPISENRTAHNWRVVGRLKDGVSVAQARQELGAIARRLKERHRDETAMVDADVRPLLDGIVGNMRAALMLLLGAAGVLLLVACVNVANLLLARALARQHEVAVRLALGAPLWRLARGFVAESLVLALSGGALGVLIARAAVPTMLALGPARLPRADDIAMDGAVLAFALAISVLAALMTGLAPLARTARRNASEALAETRRVRGGGVPGQRLRMTLIAAQIALTVVLLAGAGLLGRSFAKLLDVDPGFRTEGTLVMDVWLPEPQCEITLESMTCDAAAEARNVRYLEQLLADLRAMPGVEHVGGTNNFPLEGWGADGRFVVLERPDEIETFSDFLPLARQPGRSGNAAYRIASAEYFGAMGIPLIRGRLFDERDTRDAAHVAVISASLAQTQWPGEDPLGKLVQFGNMDGDMTPFTIVGVVGDIRERGIDSEAVPTLYADFRQRPRSASAFSIAIQGGFDSAATAETARRLARGLDPQVPVEITTLDDVKSASLADRRFVLVLASLFGGLALVLAATGVYGLMAYVVAQRTAEIGVRIALGALGRDLVRLLVGRGAVLALAGIGAGLVAALALSRVLSSFLYGVDAADPATLAATAAVLFVATLLASWIPAQRASRIDAVEALRRE